MCGVALRAKSERVRVNDKFDGCKLLLGSSYPFRSQCAPAARSDTDSR